MYVQHSLLAEIPLVCGNNARISGKAIPLVDHHKKDTDRRVLCAYRRRRIWRECMFVEHSRPRPRPMEFERFYRQFTVAAPTKIRIKIRAFKPLRSQNQYRQSTVAPPTNVRGEPVYSVMAAGWFCEKSGWIGKVEDVKPVLFKKNRISLLHFLSSLH